MRLDEIQGWRDWLRWAGDQAAHAAVGALLAFPIALLWEPTGTFVAPLFSLLAGAFRELAQWVETRKLHLLDRLIDSAFWGVGGIAAVFIAMVAK